MTQGELFPKKRRSRHLCHWPTCQKDVDPKFWGCVDH